jgi:NAD+ kinase
MEPAFSSVGVVGRSRQQDIEGVLAELLTELRGCGAEVMLEDRFADVTGRGYELYSREAIGLRRTWWSSSAATAPCSARRAISLPWQAHARRSIAGAWVFSPISARIRWRGADSRGDGRRLQQRGALPARRARASAAARSVAEGDALNDVVVNSGTSAQMIEVELYIDREFVNRQRADGLIVSTPTGSTAYSLSGGGPIMHPSLDALLVLPMFPHALSSRPDRDQGHSEIRIDVLARNRIHPPVTCDGQVNMTARPGDSVLLRASPTP